MYEFVSTVLVLIDILSKSAYYCFAGLIGLTVSLRVIRHCGEVFDAKQSVYCGKKFGRMASRREAVCYDPIIEEDIHNIRRGCFRRRNSLRGFRVTSCDYYDILALVVVFGSSLRISMAKKFRGSECGNSWSGRSCQYRCRLQAADKLDYCFENFV